jgi:SAM-dependent methyltransferase
MDPRTLEFYQSHSRQWANALPHEYSPHLDPFLDRLDPGARVLELGCGDGRDAERMIARGFAVDASDGSPEMARMASERLGRDVPVMPFEKLEAAGEYDACWCNASLLHLEEIALPGVLSRIHRALRPGGWHFASFKGGNGGHRDSFGRFYSYILRARLEAAYRSAGNWPLLEIEEEMGGSFDKQPTPWLFVIARKDG